MKEGIIIIWCSFKEGVDQFIHPIRVFSITFIHVGYWKVHQFTHQLVEVVQFQDSLLFGLLLYYNTLCRSMRVLVALRNIRNSDQTLWSDQDLWDKDFWSDSVDLWGLLMCPPLANSESSVIMKSKIHKEIRFNSCSLWVCYVPLYRSYRCLSFFIPYTCLHPCLPYYNTFIGLC